MATTQRSIKLPTPFSGIGSHALSHGLSILSMERLLNPLMKSSFQCWVYKSFVPACVFGKTCLLKYTEGESKEILHMSKNKMMLPLTSTAHRFNKKEFGKFVIEWISFSYIQLEKKIQVCSCPSYSNIILIVLKVCLMFSVDKKLLLS